VEPKICAHAMVGPRSRVSFGTWKRVEKGPFPWGGWPFFQVENSHVMEWSIWWRIGMEKRAFCSNTMYTFRSFPCIENDNKIDKITIVVHELYYLTCNLYSNLFSLKYITQWFEKFRKYVVFSTFFRVPCLTRCLRGNYSHLITYIPMYTKPLSLSP
jgi:hypothetical protein